LSGLLQFDHSLGVGLDDGPYRLLFDRGRGAPLLHVLAGHDLQHRLVIEIANDQIDLRTRAKFGLQRGESVMPVGDLGLAFDDARDNVPPEAGRPVGLPQRRHLLGVDRVAVDVTERVRLDVAHSELGHQTSLVDEPATLRSWEDVCERPVFAIFDLGKVAEIELTSLPLCYLAWGARSELGLNRPELTLLPLRLAAESAWLSHWRGERHLAVVVEAEGNRHG
jgi:hypothetical protein